MRKSLIFPLLLLTLFAIMASKCYKEDDINNRILITNKLEHAIYVVPSFEYPDTTMEFTSQEIIFANSNSFLVEANTSKRIGLVSVCYQNEWNRLLDSTERLQLFVFDKTVIEELPWDSIKSYHIRLGRYEMSYEDLVNRNCEIIIK